jgi:hypothetical protein
MTESSEVQTEIIERACRAWWDIERSGKRVATVSWDEYSKDHNLDDYRERMKHALMEIGVIP